MVFSDFPCFRSHVSYLLSQATSISEKGISKEVENATSELNVCLMDSIYPVLFISTRYFRCSWNSSPTETDLLLLLTFCTRDVAVNSLLSAFSSTIRAFTSLILLAISFSICSLLGQLGLGWFLKKSQCSYLIETPRFTYLIFLSFVIRILIGNSPFFNGLYL